MGSEPALMTAHRTKPVITTERIAWFAEYVRKNCAWGVFHVSLSDGNYECGPADEMCVDAPGDDWPRDKWIPREEWPADIREAAEWFENLTPSQRARLKRKAENLAETKG